MQFVCQNLICQDITWSAVAVMWVLHTQCEAVLDLLISVLTFCCLFGSVDLCAHILLSLLYSQENHCGEKL